ncbi:MAG: T9SS type A sorting domain-containing protein, partial [Paludibacteraceae bacterium]|nr:T9SS type A sorting domain-containing protein [Paludibacteraceae bacterium]
AKTNGTDELAGETFTKETNTFKSALLEDYIDLSGVPEVMYVGHTVQLPEFSAYGNAKVIYSVDATAMDLNGLAMTCIINEAKVITLTARTEMGDEYNAAYASKTIKVLVDDIDMSALPDTMYIGQKVTLPLLSLAGYDVTYTSNNPAILSVEGNVVTCLAATHLVVTIQGETPMVYGVQTLKKKVVYTRDNGCVDAIKQVWDDVLAIDNSGVDTVFVSYQWFKDGEELTGETRQYLQNVKGLNGSYTVEMKDANGKVYHACEFYLEPKSEKAPMMVVYPTIVPANGQYTVETSNEGEFTVISREGINADKQTLVEGQNAIVAPMQSGVYILRYETRDGEVATGKLIVK